MCFLLCAFTILFVLSLLPTDITAFVQPSPTFLRQGTALFGGYGIATNYTWTEEPFEIEVSVKVPADTRAKDLEFKATPTSIALSLDDTILLDGNRKMRGRISLDGTFWVISDNDEKEDTRLVTVTIEKNTPTAKDDFEVIDYDWKGVYPDDEDEVLERKYEEPEELDVREYAASLGVDIDNINMSMVDKTMFSSGLNLTRSTMDELSKSGYVQEVTQQSDGTEYVTNEDGQVIPFSQLGDTVKDDEVRQATSAKIPFLDTNSPWHNAVPVDDIKKDGDADSTTEDDLKEIDVDESQPFSLSKEKDDEKHTANKRKDRESDPIDTLTVKRLKEILRTQGLKVSGSKKELQDRLRSHVGAMLTTDDKTEKNVI